MLVAGQTYFDRSNSSDPETKFYRLGGEDRVHVCGAGTYPCPRWLARPDSCARQLLRSPCSYSAFVGTSIDCTGTFAGRCMRKTCTDRRVTSAQHDISGVKLRLA